MVGTLHSRRVRGTSTTGDDRRGRYVLATVLSMAMALTTSVRCAGGFVSVLDDGEKCARAPDLWACLRRGGVRAASAALAYQGEIPLLGPYLAVVPDKSAASGPEEIGRSSTGNATAAASLHSGLAEFVGKRSLQVTLPFAFVAWLVGTVDAAAEGRGKKDKGAGVLMLGGMMMITTLLSTAFGALALMATKGLLTSILALMFSAMAVAKKSGHGHARTTYEVINAPHGYKLENAEAVVANVSIKIYELFFL